MTIEWLARMTHRMTKLRAYRAYIRSDNKTKIFVRSYIRAGNQDITADKGSIENNR